jgi:phage tail protein X
MGFVNYTYPIAINWKNKHHAFRDRFLDVMFAQVELFYAAAKSGQVSRVYAADAGLASLREFLRFAADPARRLVSQHQHEVAEVHLAETGAMLGGWIHKAQKGGAR